VILEHGTSSHIGTVVAMNLHRLEKKLGCCSNDFAAFFKKTYSVSSSIMWSLCKTRRCKRMEKSTPDLVADQQSLQGVVHFLLWKTLVAQMCRDPAKICTHPKKHHLAQCQSMFKRTLESTTSTKTSHTYQQVSIATVMRHSNSSHKNPQNIIMDMFFCFLQQQESNINGTY
jgi:hypothetical protein